MISSCGRALPSRRLALSLVMLVVALALGCQRGSVSPFLRLDDARTLAASIRVQFNKADDASNRAVMADTDEASIAFARDAEAATKLVERDTAALAPLLDALGFPKEIQFFREFRRHFDEYGKLDREILGLAVENTNLKAQRLAFGPARIEADDFRSSLDAVAANLAAKDGCRVSELVSKATLAVREIQVLYAPHIASHSDDEMTRMERQIATLDRGARDAVNALGELTPPDTRALHGKALAALDEFDRVTTEILALSRRNTNVRSFDLALRSKPALVAACDDSLRALQEALAKQGSKATR